MGYNNFSGSTPKDIWNLTQIKTIYLGSNYLTGTIPNEIGHLPCLEEFVLGGNNLSGLIPTSIFNMSTISTISLDSNQFSEKEKGESCNRDYLLASTSMEKSFIPSPSNGDKWIHRKQLTWRRGFGSVYKCQTNFSLNVLQRLNILIDVASALECLYHGYETPIIHCDLKPSNILLDDDMGAHVADFGIAKRLGGGDSMTRTMTLATIGYMAPEYGMEGMVTRRGDVYSFGIVVMETFTRRKPIDEIFAGEMSLKLWVANSLDAGAVVKVVDATLLGIEEDHDFVS
ncbi:receptor kinase-like protein Xa21 [Rosa chinensis]|uniref:receptor kinase-like protein Xa21 n=1 Tax=Rosa chinensis TaxID=74649 RepID=UPI000D087F4E|nr:receptor kinase-like protein Xa21 [Rosa chinensis]